MLARTSKAISVRCTLRLLKSRKLQVSAQSAGGAAVCDDCVHTGLAAWESSIDDVYAPFLSVLSLKVGGERMRLCSEPRRATQQQRRCP